MQFASRGLIYFAILALAVGLSIVADVSDVTPMHDHAKVRCTWPAGATSAAPWYVEDIGGAESERQEGQASGRCVGIQAV